MRIAHLVGATGLNGVATSCLTLAREQVKAGHEVLLVLPENSWIGGQDIEPAIQVIKTSYKTKPAEIRRVGEAIRAWTAHVVHCHGSKANKFGMVYRLAAGAPVVMTAHTRKFQLPWLAAHIVIAPSEQTADFYHRRWLMRRSVTRIIPNMFPVESVTQVSPESRAKARALLGLQPDAFVIGTVGHLEERKNQAGMQRLAGRLAKTGVNVRLLLVGELLYSATAGERAIFRELQSDPLILMTGQRNDVPDILPAFDVFLMMSSREEAPIAPLEAMARGIATLSYGSATWPRYNPLQYLYEQGDEDGVFDALTKFAADRQLLEKAGPDCRAMVQDKLAPGIILPKMEAAYRAAIEKSRYSHFLDELPAPNRS